MTPMKSRQETFVEKEVTTRKPSLVLAMIAALFVMGFMGYIVLPVFIIFAALAIVPLGASWLALRVFDLLTKPDHPGELPLGSFAKERSFVMPYRFETEMTSVLMQAHNDELTSIDRDRLPAFLAQLPSDSTQQMKFFEHNGKWLYSFTSKSVAAEFYASGYGDSPAVAYAIAEQILQRQLREWHQVRETGEKYIGRSLAPIPDEVQAGRVPIVLVVDDDIDAAEATAAVFRQMGCKTLVSSGEDTERIIAFGDVDFIVLDWILGETKRGSQIVEKAAKIIQNISDLRDKFHRSRPKVVTYSVLRSSQIDLPESEYFYHVDHWQKPIRQDELAMRTSELLVASGY